MKPITLITSIITAIFISCSASVTDNYESDDISSLMDKCKKRDQKAYAELAKRYKYGIGVEQSYVNAVFAIKKANENDEEIETWREKIIEIIELIKEDPSVADLKIRYLPDNYGEMRTMLYDLNLQINSSGFKPSSLETIDKYQTPDAKYFAYILLEPEHDINSDSTAYILEKIAPKLPIFYDALAYRYWYFLPQDHPYSDTINTRKALQMCKLAYDHGVMGDYNSRRLKHYYVSSSIKSDDIFDENTLLQIWKYYTEDYDGSKLPLVKK